MGLPSNWPELRNIVLQRDGHSCSVCGTKSNLHVHHIYPKYFSNNHQLSNLITLCDKCHSDKHIELQISLTRRSFEFIVYKFKTLYNFLAGHKGKSINYYPLLRLLTGYSNFRSGQKEIIDEIIAGRNVLVIRPTGSGKSLLFQLPAIVSKKPSIVLSPLKALMKDQVESLWKRGIPVSFINSDISSYEKSERIRLFQNNGFKLLYVAPERFDKNMIFNEKEITALTNTDIEYLIIDEAHNIDDWGFSFRQNYQRIKQIRMMYKNPKVIALTATATPHVRKEIINSVGIENPKIFIQGFDRPNIILHNITCKDRQFGSESIWKTKVIKSILSKIGSNKKTIIYVPTLKIGDALKKSLVNYGIKIEFYHSQLNPIEKTNIQNRFTGLSEPKLNILISTSAFGMGIDIPNIRYVIHWSQPKSLNSYYQEIGRAGRDNNPSLAVLLKVKSDEQLIEFMMKKTIESSNLSESFKGGRYKIERDELKKIVEYSLTLGCLRRFVHDYFEATYNSLNKSIFVRLFYFIFNIRLKNYKYCCTNCDRLYIGRKLDKVFKQVNKF